MGEEKIFKLVIVEDNENLSSVMEHYFEGLNAFKVVGTAHDGESGLRMIMSQTPDAAIIDLILPGKDGFYILDELKKNPNKKPVCVILSGLGLEHVTARAIEKGADFFVVKPFDLPLLSRRIIEVWQDKNRLKDIVNGSDNVWRIAGNRDEFVVALLHSVPISNTLAGYEYLKAAIQLAIDDKRLLESITKSLYPTVAKHCKTSSPRVERAIRHAISSAWRKGGGCRFAEIMGYDSGTSEQIRPTNSAFIASAAELYQRTYQ